MFKIMDRNEVLSRVAIDEMIDTGAAIVILSNYVLRLDSWLNKHPGGPLVIAHMVGRDATDEITAYHSSSTIRTMEAYRIGRVPTGIWINRVPPIRRGNTYGPNVFNDDVAVVHSLDSTDTSEPNYGNQTNSDRKSIAYLATALKASSLATALKASSPTGIVTILHPANYINKEIRQAVNRDVQDYPNLHPVIQHDIECKYRALHQRVVNEGLYDHQYGNYAREMVRYICLFAGFMCTLHLGWYIISAVLLGLFWHQIMFTAHDAGHRAITGNLVIDTLIGMFIADLCCGLSIGWWKSSHNIHHLVTNQPEHDPDIQNVPIFATSPRFFRSIRSTYYNGFVFTWDSIANFMIPYQKYTYYPIMGIARFNLYLLSWLHVLASVPLLLSNGKLWWVQPAELAFMCGYWFLFGYCLLWRTLPTWTNRIVFSLISHIVTMPLHVQITLSHWGMSTSYLGESESFAQRQLRTTMDIQCPIWLDFIHGGLQFQVAHHLFPRLPRHNLRRAQSLVKEFCKEVEIPYSIMGFRDGNRKVLDTLDSVSIQLEMLLNCHRHMAETGETGLR